MKKMDANDWEHATIYWYKSEGHMSVYIPTVVETPTWHRSIDSYKGMFHYNRLAPVLSLMDPVENLAYGARFNLTAEEYWAIMGVEDDD